MANSEPEHVKAYQTALTLVCPIRHTLMVDPVILRNGKTYDRSSIESFFAYGDHYIQAGYRDPISHIVLEDPTLVPNNAIKSLIEQFVNTYEHEQQDEWSDVVDLCREYRTRKSEEINIEEEYERAYQTAQTLICPISKHLMVDPVINANGDTYDRSSLERFTFINGEYRDPKTLLPMTDLTILPNDVMTVLIKQFVEKYGGKQGQDWEHVVNLCTRYRTTIIEQRQEDQRRERHRQAREQRERLIDEAGRRARRITRVPINFSHARAEAYLDQIEEEARREAQASLRPLSGTVIDMNQRLAEIQARRAARRASDIESNREEDE